MNRLWMGMTVLSVAGIVLFGWLLRKRLIALQKQHRGYQPPQMRFGYDPAALTREWDGMDAQARALLVQFDWLFVPLLFYVGVAMAVVAHNTASLRWMAWAMNALAAAAVVCGMAESLLLLGEKLTVKAAKVCSLVKWICFGLWVVGMFAGLFLRSAAL